MHNISEKVGEAKQYSREFDYINTIGQLHPVTTETWSQAREYSQDYDTSDEESLTPDMNDNYETLIENTILEVCAMRILHALHLMTNIWKVGSPMISLKPSFLRKIVLSRMRSVARDLIPVIRHLSYLT